MRESEHFNLFLADGSDIVNPLVQDVQNYEVIDEQMFKNQNAGVHNATELKNGTVHAITRNVPDAQFITFTATSNYIAGETFTVDGIQVTALTVSGETLPTGAYVINSQVLCVLKGTLLTVYGVGSEVADNSLALNGHPDTYFGTKEDVDNAIDTANAANELVNEVNSRLANKTELPEAVTGTFGGYQNVVAGFLKQGYIFNIFFKGQVTGTIDIPYSEFGIDSTFKLPSTMDGSLLATVTGGGGGTLTVKAYSTALQLRSSLNNDGYYFNVTLPLK